MRPSSDLTNLLATIVRGDRVPAHVLESLDPRVVIEAARHHLVSPLVADGILNGGDAPDALKAALKKEARASAAIDLVREAELRACVGAFDDAQIPALLMKGAHLAYSHYRRPDLRARLDSDLMIPRSKREQVHALLSRLGYVSPAHVSGDLIMSQAMYVKSRGTTMSHAVDVHWRIANPQAFAAYLSYEELAKTAVAIPALSPVARGLSNVHALLVACVHRVAHHYDSDCLAWLYDIHLIASGLTNVEWTEFVDLAKQKGLALVCRQSLDRAIEQFRTAVPAAVRTRLESAASSETNPAHSSYLVPGHRHVQHVWSDLRALPTWAARMRLAREHLLPPAQYMRMVYAPSSAAPLPVLYASRAWRGVRKWLRRST